MSSATTPGGAAEEEEEEEEEGAGAWETDEGVDGLGSPHERARPNAASQIHRTDDDDDDDAMILVVKSLSHELRVGVRQF